MATKNENRPIGTEMHKDKKIKLTKDGEKRQSANHRNDGDGEAGIDPQTEQLNDMPNDPTDHPKELGKVVSRKA